MTGLAIEAAGIAALDLLAKLHAACFAEPWDRVAFARLLAMPGAFALTAADRATGARPLGLVLGRTAADEGEVLSLAVLPEGRRRGVGSALIEACLDHAAAAGAGEVYLEVGQDNQAALALYRRAGFRPVGYRPGYYRDRRGQRTTAVVMRRSLPGRPRPSGSLAG